jgi:hypothetical protein
MWSNFEFISNDGHINEVDALILTSKGLFLVEIKSRPARRLTGDAYAWSWLDGSRTVETDNPVILTDRKSKRLASARGLASDSASSRTAALRPHSEEGLGVARRPGPVPGAWSPNNPSLITIAPPPFNSRG